MHWQLSKLISNSIADAIVLKDFSPGFQASRVPACQRLIHLLQISYTKAVVAGPRQLKNQLKVIGSGRDEVLRLRVAPTISQILGCASDWRSEA